MVKHATRFFIQLLAIAVFSFHSSCAQTIITICGTGASGFSSDSGPASASEIFGASFIDVDRKGNIYFTDSLNNCKIKKINTSHIISLFAGNGTFTYSGDGGPATGAGLTNTHNINHDKYNNIYLGFDGLIRKIDTNGIITTFAGTNVRGFSGDGGPATNAKISNGYGMCFDRYNNCFFADYANYRIRKIDTNNIITTIAGTGTLGSTGDGGPATTAWLDYPDDVRIDSLGNIYFAETGSTVGKIRKIDTSGIITTFAGTTFAGYTGDGGPATAAKIWGPYTLDNCGNILISTNRYNRIRIIDHSSGIINLLYGTASAGYAGDGGPASSAQFHFPGSLTTDCVGNIFVVDDSNFRIREILYPNSTPYFTGGRSQSISLCHDSGPYDLNTLLAVTDSDCGQVLSWAAVSAPVHGSLAATFTANTNTHTVTPAGLSYTPTAGYSGVDSFSVRVADCGNLADTTIVYVTVIPPPDSGVITGPSVVCLASSITLTDTASGGVWRSNTALVATVSGTGVVTGIAAGADTIFYTNTNSCGADSVFHIVMVTSTPPPTAPITGAGVVCIGANVTLTDTTAGGVWRTGAAGIATVSGTGVVTGVASGIDTIYYTVAHSCGSDSVFHIVTVNPLPHGGVIAGATSVCVGSTITLTDTTTGGTWSYSGSAGIATVSAGGVVTGIGTGSAVITYTVTNGCGTATTTYTITVNPLPVAGTIGGAGSVCAGATTTLTDAGGGSGVWSTGAAGIASVSAGGAVSGVSAGTATISYTVTNGCGSATATYSIAVNPLPDAGSVSGATSLCTGAITTLTDAGGGSGAWSSAAAGIANVSAGGVVGGVSAGIATISYTVTSSCGSATATYTITVNTIPSAGTIGGAGSVCAGATISLSETVTGGSWSTGAAGVASVSAGGAVSGVSVGTATISYSVTNTCGTAYATYALTVTTNIVSPVTGPTSVCIGDTILLIDTASGGTWLSGATAVATVSGTGTVYGVSAGATGITYSYNNSCGTVNAVHGIAVDIAPTGTISGASQTCEGSTSTLLATPSSPYWSASNNNATVSTGGIVTGASAGVDTIYNTFTNACGSTTASFIDTVIGRLSFGSLGTRDTVCEGDSLDLHIPIPGGYLFSSNGNAEVSSSSKVTGIRPGYDTITYSLVNTCGSSEAVLLVTILPRWLCGLSAIGYQPSVFSFSVYPNPNFGSFTINISSPGNEDVPVIIYNMMGEKVKEFSIGTNKDTEVQLNVPAGVYCLSAITESGKITARLVVE